MNLMSPADLESNLVTLAQKIADAGIPSDFYLVGGAAMSIGYMPDRRLTTDIDAKINNFEQLKPLVEEVAAERGLASDWLNTAAAKLIGQMTTDTDWILWKKIGRVRIYFASLELLLAMKAVASRPAKDSADIALLLKSLAITSVDEVEEIYERYFPGDLLPQKAIRLLSVLLNEVH